MKSIEMVGFVSIIDSLVLVVACYFQGEIQDVEFLRDPQLAEIIAVSAAIKGVSGLMYQKAVQVSGFKHQISSYIIISFVYAYIQGVKRVTWFERQCCVKGAFARPNNVIESICQS